MDADDLGQGSLRFVPLHSPFTPPLPSPCARLPTFPFLLLSDFLAFAVVRFFSLAAVSPLHVAKVLQQVNYVPCDDFLRRTLQDSVAAEEAPHGDPEDDEQTGAAGD